MRFSTSSKLALYIALGLGFLTASVVAQGSSLNDLPTCAEGCANTAASNAKCPLSNAAAPCLCFSNFRNDVVSCSQSACKIEDRGSVQGVMDTFCNGVTPTTSASSTGSSSSSSHSSSSSKSQTSTTSQTSRFSTSTSTGAHVTPAQTQASPTTTNTNPNGGTTIATSIATSIGTGIPSTAIGIIPTDGSSSTDAGDGTPTDVPTGGALGVKVGMGSLVFAVALQVVFGAL